MENVSKEGQPVSTVIRLSDLPLCASLATFGIFPVFIAPQDENSRRWEFSYPPSKEMGGIITQYWNRALAVEPQAFALNLKLLKGRLYDAQSRRAS